MDPIVNEVAKKFGGQLKLVRVDLDTSGGMKKAQDAGVRAVPTVILYNSAGHRVNTLVGSQPRATLENHITTLLAR